MKRCLFLLLLALATVAVVPAAASATGYTYQFSFGSAGDGDGQFGTVFGADYDSSADRLYVADSSVFPTNLGVNPQIAIMALAQLCAERILG